MELQKDHTFDIYFEMVGADGIGKGYETACDLTATQAKTEFKKLKNNPKCLYAQVVDFELSVEQDEDVFVLEFDNSKAVKLSAKLTNKINEVLGC